MNDLTAFMQSIALDDYKAIRRLQVKYLRKDDRGYDPASSGISRYSPIVGAGGGLIFPRAFIPQYLGSYEIGDGKSRDAGAIVVVRRDHILSGNDVKITEAVSNLFIDLLKVANGTIPIDSPIEIDHSTETTYVDKDGASISTFICNQVAFRVRIDVPSDQIQQKGALYPFPVTVIS